MMYRHLKYSRKGFTLAEVLITLAVVGVVAALSVPGLVQSINNQQYVTGLKKFVSTFQNGMQKYMVDQGCVGNLACTNVFFNVSWHGGEVITIDKMVKSVFSVQKACINPYDAADRTCVQGSYKALNNTTISGDPGFYVFNDSRAYEFITSDGMLIWILDGNMSTGNCDDSGNNISKISPVCAQIAVDINGSKPPNILGRDYFFFFLSNNGLLYPYGGVEWAKYIDGDSWKTSNSYWKNYPTFHCGIPNSQGTNTSAFGCSARIIEEGWQMTY